MGGEVDVPLASLRRRVRIACLASLLLLLAVFDAPELTSLRWGVGLVSAAAVAGLLASTSRERSGDGTSPSAVWLSSILVGVGALLVAFGALLAVDWYATPGLDENRLLMMDRPRIGAANVRTSRWVLRSKSGSTRLADTC